MTHRIVYTIGHSTHPIDEFIALLRQNKVTQLVDIRTIPRSRHNPQFEQAALEMALATANITYTYDKDLGGLRPRAEHSTNTAWRNASFRNYADYMQTDTFAKAVDELVAYSARATTAIMCAEAVPWRCHRSLVADALTVRGVAVKEIISNALPKEHVLTKFAVVHGTQVTYPGGEDDEKGDKS